MGLYVGNTKYKPIIGGVGYKVVRELPYDAEIEYLQTDGNQFIETGILIGDKTDITVDGQLSSIVLQVRVIGTGNGYFEIYINGSSRWSATSNGSVYSGGGSNPANTSRHKFRLSNVNNRAYIDNKYWVIGHNGASYQGVQIAIFGRPYEAASANRVIGYLYSAQIFENSVLVRDYIPVRVGTTGYLYDKVSGQLFGNAGTGSFILGNDKN